MAAADALGLASGEVAVLGLVGGDDTVAGPQAAAASANVTSRVEVCLTDLMPVLLQTAGS
jgi:hypothetical protein